LDCGVNPSTLELFWIWGFLDLSDMFFLMAFGNSSSVTEKGYFPR